MRCWLAIALFLAIPRLSWATEPPHARASCPEGSTMTGGLGGSEICTPTNCAADSDCEPGRLCRERPLCIETRMGTTTKNAVGTCESGAKCTYPAECEEASKRCVRAGIGERYRTSCGCRIPGGSGAGPAPAISLALVAFVAFALAHRRARRAPGV